MFSRSQLCGLVAVAVAVCLPTRLHAETIGIAWRTNLDAAKIEAAQTNRLLLLHFWTRSCAPCKLLDQNVLSQPQVGDAVERDYVPIKIDADASPALAHMFKIDRVPTEVVLTPESNLLTTLSTPDNPDAYVAQLQNVARHFRQTTPGALPGAPAQTVNSAYANLPQRPTTAAAASALAAGAGAQAMVPQTPAVRPQYNPYITPPTTAQSQGLAPPTAQVAAVGAANGSFAPNGQTMPANAMPQSYRNQAFAGAPATAGAAVVAPFGVVPGSSAVSPAAPQTVANPAYAAVGGGTAPGSGATAPTNQVAMASAQVSALQAPLPPNCPPVAFDGCCPVTLKTLNKWAPGSTAFGAIHRGRTYLFAGEAERQQFLADPDSYSPVFAGLDPVLLLDRQQTVQGSRKFGFKYGNAFYLFSCAETRDRFRESPQTYAAGVRQAMAKVDAGIVRR